MLVPGKRAVQCAIVHGGRGVCFDEPWLYRIAFHDNVLVVAADFDRDEWPGAERCTAHRKYGRVSRALAEEQLRPGDGTEHVRELDVGRIQFRIVAVHVRKDEGCGVHTSVPGACRVEDTVPIWTDKGALLAGPILVMKVKTDDILRHAATGQE